MQGGEDRAPRLQTGRGALYQEGLYNTCRECIIDVKSIQLYVWTLRGMEAASARPGKGNTCIFRVYTCILRPLAGTHRLARVANRARRFVPARQLTTDA